MALPHERASSPAELEASVASMAKIRGCWSPSFSPDGGRLAFVSDLNGLPQVWTVPVEGGWPELVTDLDDQIYRVAWSPQGDVLAFALAPGGGMNQQVYLVQPDGTGLRRLTDGGKETNWLGGWTYSGRQLTFSSNRRTPGAMDAYLADVESGQLRLVARNQGIGDLTDVSRDEKFGLLYRMVNRSDNDLFLLDLENGREVLLTPHEGPGRFDNGRFSPDGQTVYLTSNKDREMAAFARVVLAERGRPGPVEVLAAREDAELDMFAINEDGALAALVWNVAGRNEIEFIDLRNGQRAAGPGLPGQVVYSLDFSRAGSLLAMTITGAAAPRDIWVYDGQAGRLWPVTRSPHPGIVLDRLVQPELVHFTAQDGLGLSGWLYLPAGFPAPGPIVLSFHGGPESQEQPYFSIYYQALLSQGIAVFAPNVRGSSGFGKTFVNLDNGPLRVNAVLDIRSCVDYLVGAGVAAPGRMGIMGGSYGGYMTMAGLTEHAGLFAAGAVICGIVNFETFFANTEPWMAEISTVEYGDPQTQREMLRRLSPIHKVDQVQAATIVLHGANDTNVPVVEAEQVVESLQARRVPVKYVLFPDEGHGFTKITNRITAVVEITRWFADHLSPH